MENLYELNEKRALDKAQFRRIIVENELHVAIMPGNASPVSEHYTYGLPPYTVYINYLDVSPEQSLKEWVTYQYQHPACVLPYGIAT